LNIAHVRDLIRQIKPDILQAFHVTSYGLLAALSRVHPLIVTVWGTDVLLAPRKNPLYNLITRYALRKADYITATGPRLGEATTKYAPKAKKINIIPYGIDLKVFSPNRRLRGDKELTIGAIRHLKSVHGLDYLLRAMPMVSAQHPGTRLLLVGDGPQRSYLEGLAQSLGISDQVQFGGNVPHQKVPSYLESIDIFVMPSISEGLGVAAIEASAMGIPVVASNVGGVPDAVIDGETGFLVPPKDSAAIATAIIELVEKPKLRLRMGQAGRKFVAENYEWDENAARMEKLYYSIVQEV
jgi:glycosyltransferase involved in cell wall biosynthesis